MKKNHGGRHIYTSYDLAIRDEPRGRCVVADVTNAAPGLWYVATAEFFAGEHPDLEGWFQIPSGND